MKQLSEIAVIPARGGSKDTSKKYKKFAGKPMISYAIAAAKESKLFDQIVVSTVTMKLLGW